MIGFIMELQYPNQKITLNSQPGIEHFEQRDSENKNIDTFCNLNQNLSQS